MSVFRDTIRIRWGRTAVSVVQLLATVLPEAGRDVKGARETGVHFIQTYLNGLSKEFHDDMNVLICDGAAWHKAGKLMILDMITILFIPL